MNVTHVKQNVQLGQSQEFEIQLDESLVFRFLDKAIIVKDIDNTPQMQFIIDGGLLKYQLWNGSGYNPPQTITNTNVSCTDSSQLPHTPSNNYLSVNGTGFKVFLDTVQKLLLINDSLQLNIQEINIDNGFGDFAMKFKSQLGQSFYFKDYDTQANILSIGSYGINMQTKQIKSLSNGTDPQDAVSLSQLQNFAPNNVQIRNPDSQIHFKNTLNNDLMNLDNSRLNSNVLINYAQHNAIQSTFQVPDWQNVLTEIAQYQLLSAKDAAFGYVGVDGSGKSSIITQRSETLRIDGNTIKPYGVSNITTNNLTEGTNNKYYTQQRVSDYIDTIKAVPNGIPSLDGNGIIPANQIPAFPIGSVFYGLDADKTNPLNYPGNTPIAGDRYISTDSGLQYILATIPYTINGNWIVISAGNVDSVNTQTGIVSLDTNDIPEGTQKYFASGIVDYKLNDANNPDELLKLDNLGFIDTQYLPASIKLNAGSMQLVDNQSNQLDIQNSLNNASVLNVQRTQVIASQPLRNNSIPIIDNNQFTDKSYVDTKFGQVALSYISNNNTEVQTNNNNVETTVNGALVRVDGETSTLHNTPIVYNEIVPVTQDQQLATKKYVDDVLSDFISNSGVNKEYLQVVSTVSRNTNGRITGWSSNVQSSTQTRINIASGDTFDLVAGVYRFYIGLKLKEFKDSGLMNVSVVIRDSISLVQYMIFDFKTLVDAAGGNQEFTMTQPYLWNMVSSVNIEVYALIGDTDCELYESYLLIEEVEKVGVDLGRDRLTDPTLNSIVQLTNQYLDFNINNIDYGTMQDNKMQFASSIKVCQDLLTPITDSNQLTTKQYVDNAVDNSTISITNLGQMFQAALSINQVTFLTSGNPVKFDTTILNTSSTISIDNTGKITFAQGFVYQVHVSVGVQFINSPAFAIMDFKNFNTLAIIPGSKMYMVTQPSQNANQTSVSFFIDLRAAVSPQTYILNIESSLQLGSIYKDYTRITCEQKQIINDQLWDRIQNLDNHSSVYVYNQGIRLKVDDDVLENTVNNSGSIERQLQIDDANSMISSTNISNTIQQQLKLNNANNAAERTSTVLSDVNSEVQTILQALVTAGAGQKQANIGGLNADILQLFVQNSGTPLMQFISSLATLYTQLSMNNNKIVSLATPTADADASTKLYVDNSMPVGAILMWYAVSPPTGYLVCNGASFSNITYPLLATVLGSTTLPDLRGAFTRGYDPTATRDPDGVSRAIGSIQTEGIKQHNHTVNSQIVPASFSGTTSSEGNHQHWTPYSILMAGAGAANADIGGDNSGNGQYKALYFNQTDNFANSYTQYAGAHTHTFSGSVSLTIPQQDTQNTGITETRPINISVQYIIKAL